MRKLSLVLFCAFVLLFQACQNFEDIKEIDSVEHSPEFAVPLVNSTLSLNDVLENDDDLSFLEIDPDGAMTAKYTQENMEQAASELIQEMEDFPVVLIDSFMSVPVNLFENLSVSQLNLKNGTLEFDIQSSHTEDIDLTITFPGMTKNGVPFQVQTSMDYQGNTPVSTNIPATPLQDFELSLAGGNLEIRYEAYNTMGDRVLLDLISGEAKNWEYSSIEGVWENETFPLDNDTIDIDLFGNSIAGQISLEDPKLAIDLVNSIGFPVQLKIQNMTAYLEDGTSMAVSSILNSGYTLNYPALNEMGQEKMDQIVLDKNNSNIISVLNAQPKYIIYDIIAVMNPDSTTANGFITENSKIEAKATLELPIYGTASGFTLESTTAFDVEDVDVVEYAEFKLVTNNGIPVDLNTQFYFLDDLDNVIDSLFENQQSILQAPEIGANGTVISTTEETNIINIPADKFYRIQSATKVKVNAAFSTANQGTIPVRILTSQELEVRMGAKFGLE